MNAPPLVSVVLCFLDAEPFLEEAITSVLQQSYDSVELILMDDGSSDGSTEIARQYAARDPDRIYYLEHDGHRNLGLSASRNGGIRHARGAYIALIDADDVWLPHKLEEQMSILEAHPEVGMVCGASEYWYSWADSDNGQEQDTVVPIGAPADTVIEPPLLLTYLYPLGEGAAPCPSGLLLRRQTIQEVGGFEEHFRGAYTLYEDQAFLSKVYLGTPVFVSGACLDRYRQRPDSCVATTTREGKYHLVRQYYLRWFYSYFAQQDAYDARVHRALRRALRPYRRPSTLQRLTEYTRTHSPIKRLVRRGIRSTVPAPVYQWLRNWLGRT